MKKISAKNIAFLLLVAANAIIILFIAYNLLKILKESDFFVRNMERLTLSEQNEHKENMLQIMEKLKNDSDSLRSGFDDLKDKRAVNYQDKADIYQKIDNLEKDIRNLDVEHDYYITDISIDINPYKDRGIENFMDHSENLSVKAKRLVRYMEYFIYTKGAPTADQVTLIERGFANVDWETDILEKQ